MARLCWLGFASVVLLLGTAAAAVDSEADGQPLPPPRARRGDVRDARHAVEVEARVVEAHAAAVEKKKLAKARATTWGKGGGGGGADGGGSFAQWIDAANPALTLELMKIRAMVDERWVRAGAGAGGGQAMLRPRPVSHQSHELLPQPGTTTVCHQPRAAERASGVKVDVTGPVLVRGDNSRVPDLSSRPTEPQSSTSSSTSSTSSSVVHRTL